MTFYFIGGEDHDFTKIGVCVVDTALTAARRAGLRCSLKVGGVGSALADGWVAQLSAPQSSFWVTARYYQATDTTVLSNSEFFSLFDGSVKRLVLFVNTGTGTLRLSKRNAAGTLTTLADSSMVPVTAIQKLDVQVVYGTSGSIKVWQDGTLMINYSGDVTTDGATTLSSFALGSCYGNSTTRNMYWSEVIAASVDTRSLALVTLPPLANGNAFNWTTGTTTNLNEVTLDDATLATSATAGQIAQSTITSTGITGNPQIVAVGVTARAQKGTTGPSKADLGVRTASTDYWSPDIALPVSLDRISNVWETNPNTSAPWLYTDLTNAGFNIGMKSVT